MFGTVHKGARQRDISYTATVTSCYLKTAKNGVIRAFRPLLKKSKRLKFSVISSFFIEEICSEMEKRIELEKRGKNPAEVSHKCLLFVNTL